MNRAWLRFSWIVFTVILFCVPSAFPASPRPLPATVQRVSDGDTVVATTADGTKLRVRLLSIDAPEIPHGNKPGQPYNLDERRSDANFPSEQAGVGPWGEKRTQRRRAPKQS
jgi:endonuclease YncB( thermonuclease family)